MPLTVSGSQSISLRILSYLYSLSLILYPSGCLGRVVQLHSGEASRGLFAASYPSCVCIFDFDGTLRLYMNGDGDAPSYDAAKVIRACVSTPCAIAIASANGNRYKLEHVLSSRYSDLGLFTEEFFASQAFQYGSGDKAPMLWAIKEYYNIQSTSCMVFFDDQPHNGDYANQVGAKFVLVNPSYGIQSKDFNAGMDAMSDQCFPGGRPGNI